ncbi:MAG TPA: methyltransferase domain-containing protein [Polyangiaceae bacterium]|nr:methyltransferase domain-containing protein [Polyangiaceae bacterium]
MLEPPRETSSAFDSAAHRYDADEARNPAFEHIRARSFAHLRRAFAPGSTLLEIGSGTGTEAARLVAERGCRVALVDVSPSLLDAAARKVTAARSDGLLGRHVSPAASLGDLVATYGRGFFDGAYSSLGPLNCEPRLEPVAAGLAALVRPGGAVVLSPMNRWCLTEAAWFAAHRRWREAARRWGGPVQASVYPGGPRTVTTWYYSRREVVSAFGGPFRLEHAEALPFLWPPTYLGSLVARHATIFRALAPIEERTASWPVLRDLGDHVLLRFARR